MKSIKMILTAFLVFTVVGSALSFKRNRLRPFCASVTQDVGCTIVQKNKCNGPGNFFEYKLWDSTAADCLSTRCHDQICLTN